MDSMLESVATHLGVAPDPLKVASKLAPTSIDQNTTFWEAYNKAGDDEDKDFVKMSGGDLDALLIFAGLFSATNTAFIIESYKTLKADPADRANELLQSLLSIAQHSPATDSTESFKAKRQDIIINAFFFASLCCSLSAAFGAVLAKQWLTQYDRDGGGLLKTPSARGRERQRKYEGRDKWHLEDVVVTLPTLLQLSLFFFFIGLVILLWPLNDVVTAIALLFSVATFLFYIITITISICDESAPFQTRLSLTLRTLSLHSLVKRTKRLANRLGSLTRWEFQAKAKRNPDISCISYLLERVTKPEDVGVVAEAFVTVPLLEGRDTTTMSDTFVNFHLKPTLDKDWSIPSLYGPARSSLLKILNILVKKWNLKDSEAFTKSPLYPLDMSKFSDIIPRELRRAFLAAPADTESFHCLVEILFTMGHLGQPPQGSDPDGMEKRKLWLEDDVTAVLKDQYPAAQRNTLALLTLATAKQTPEEQVSAWETVKKAAGVSSGLKDVIHSMVWEEISSSPAQGATEPSTPYLLEWIAISQDLNALADALETRPSGLETVVVAEKQLVSSLVDRLISSHLKSVDGLWTIPGLSGSDRIPLLRILRILVVTWKYLDRYLVIKAESFPPPNAQAFLTSLRTELWRAFLAKPEDPDAVPMIADICKNLTTPVCPMDPHDDANTTALRSLNIAISKQFQENQTEAAILKHCFSILCSNADTLASSPNFHAIRLVPGGPRAIPEDLFSSMWIDTKADLDDFWKAMYRVQLLPTFFPNKLREMRFAEYLHLWFQRFTKSEPEAQADNQLPLQQTAQDKVRQKWLHWTYILSLQRLLTSSEASEWSKELKEHGHQSHLLEIILDAQHHLCSTSAPIALHSFLRLWSDGTSEGLTSTMAKGARGVVKALLSGNLHLGLMSLDIRLYTECSRDDTVSHEQWSEGTSVQIQKDMSEMMGWLDSYLHAVIERGLVDMKGLDKALSQYGLWCQEMDEKLTTKEYRRLSQDLNEIGKVFKESQTNVGGSSQIG